MGKLVAFEWVSVDGVFDASNMDEWFFPYDSKERRKAIKETYQQADAILMGRKTYEMLAPYWAGLPDDDKDGLAGVLTHTPKFIASSGNIVANWGDTSILGEDVENKIKKLKNEHKNILIIGSATLTGTLAQIGLMDEYKLLVQPFIVGAGRQFFDEKMKTGLQLAGIEKVGQDVLLLHYRIKG